MAVVEAELIRQLAIQTVIEQHELGTAAANAHEKSGKQGKDKLGLGKTQIVIKDSSHTKSQMKLK